MTLKKKRNSRALLAPHRGKELKISMSDWIKPAFNIKYSRKNKHTMEFLFNFPHTYLYSNSVFSFEFTPGIQSTTM